MAFAEPFSLLTCENRLHCSLPHLLVSVPRYPKGVSLWSLAITICLLSYYSEQYTSIHSTSSAHLILRIGAFLWDFHQRPLLVCVLLMSSSGSGAFPRIFTGALRPFFNGFGPSFLWMVSRPGLACFCLLLLDVLHQFVMMAILLFSWLKGDRPEHIQAAASKKNPSGPTYLRVEGVVREDPSTKVPPKVWTLQAFNEGPLLGAGGGGAALRPSEAQTFEGTFKGTFKGDLQRYLQRSRSFEGSLEGRDPSKVPSKGTFKGTFKGPDPSKVAWKVATLRRYLRRPRYLCVKYVPKQSMP